MRAREREREGGGRKMLKRIDDPRELRARSGPTRRGGGKGEDDGASRVVTKRNKAREGLDGWREGWGERVVAGKGRRR